MPPIPPIPIGVRIASLRQQRGWSQAMLGGAVGLWPGTIRQIEDGLIVPEQRRIVALSQALGVPFTELLGRAN
jgi:transcriptional regulator with XRE-family HTH domain